MKRKVARQPSVWERVDAEEAQFLADWRSGRIQITVDGNDLLIDGQKFARLDTAETIFFRRELEYRKAQTYDIIRAPLNAFTMFPVVSTAGPGAESIVYEQYDMTGVAKIIANYATDLPRVDVVGREFIAKIKSVGASYGYSLQEIRAAMFAGKPLQQRKADAAVRAHRELWNRTAFYGDALNGIPGFLNNPNIPLVNATQAAWTPGTLDPDTIILELNDLANGIVTDTNGAEIPDTVAMPLRQYSLIATTPRSNVSDTTILEFFLANQPYIKKVIPINELSAEQILANGLSGSFTGGVIVAFRQSPDVLTLEMPQQFEQLPIQEKGLEFEVPCHSRIAGVLVYYPHACRFLDSFEADATP